MLKIPLWLSSLRTQYRLHEGESLIPGLARWIKDPLLPQATVEVTDVFQI